MVISNTPLDALQRDWQENNIVSNILYIGGQETGNKTEMLTALSTKYPSGNILIIGDSPGDLKAAKNAQTLFFPVLPMKEEKSWKLFLNEGIERFFNHQFKGKFEDKCITDFHNVLQTEPSW
jgi:2-hydroxy-3-keto-5-methylthiopentenyl-1-phosphate phosphatase